MDFAAGEVRVVKTPDTYTTFRVWPDGTVQAVEDGEPYSWMSDDFMTVKAADEEHAIKLCEVALRSVPVENQAAALLTKEPSNG